MVFFLKFVDELGLCEPPVTRINENTPNDNQRERFPLFGLVVLQKRIRN
jgi:hypothetical protein